MLKILKNKKSAIKNRMNNFQMIVLGFAIVILVGTFILMTPIASRSHEWTPASDAMFTAVSAVCVTGLVVRDTAQTWSMFGQIVVITLIQIGGLGVITTSAFFALLAGKKIGLEQRTVMQEAISAPEVGGIVRLTEVIIKMTAIIELAGAAAMALAPQRPRPPPRKTRPGPPDRPGRPVPGEVLRQRRSVAGGGGAADGQRRSARAPRPGRDGTTNPTDPALQGAFRGLRGGRHRQYPAGGRRHLPRQRVVQPNR